MSTPTTTIMTATIAGFAAAAFVGRNMGPGASPYLARDMVQDSLLAFGGLIVAGCLLGGVHKPDSIGRGLLWGAGGLAAAYGIDKALVRK